MADTLHQPVMLAATLEWLQPTVGECYLDLTAGTGGHATAFAQAVGIQGQVILVDRDPRAINHLQARFPDAQIIYGDFAGVAAGLVEQRQAVDIVLADLGISSWQLTQADRGFSFQQASPLDMRMDPSQRLTAADIVNRYDQRRLADLIFAYGEERRSRVIAAAIVARRPLHDTAQLAAVIAGAVGGRRGRIHPATRTFQALRIAVNQELEQLEQLLALLPQLLKPGGRVGIISFHSLEDRWVKRMFRDLEELTPLTKKPLKGDQLDVSNPRARSAKFRAASKIKTKN